MGPRKGGRMAPSRARFPWPRSGLLVGRAPPRAPRTRGKRKWPVRAATEPCPSRLCAPQPAAVIPYAAALRTLPQFRAPLRLCSRGAAFATAFQKCQIDIVTSTCGQLITSHHRPPPTAHRPPTALNTNHHHPICQRSTSHHQHQTKPTQQPALLRLFAEPPPHHGLRRPFITAL